ncbi:MAG: GntR family transcriptional regulator [Caldilineaceae bacterium]
MAKDSTGTNNHTQLNRHVLRDEIKEYLIDAILRGKYQPGERLTELTLARHFGVSQAPIREALGHLELMGFVESKPYRGTYIHKHSPEELFDIYTVRAWLEALAGRLAATRLTEADLAELTALVNQMVECANENNAQAFYKADYAFHEMIVRAANNTMLARLFDTLQYAYWTFASTILFDYDLVYLAKRHYSVIEALRNREPNQAAHVLQNHIEELIVPLSTKSSDVTTQNTTGATANGPSNH